MNDKIACHSSLLHNPATHLEAKDARQCVLNQIDNGGSDNLIGKGLGEEQSAGAALHLMDTT
jgi:hypothetical protein